MALRIAGLITSILLAIGITNACKSRFSAALASTPAAAVSDVDVGCPQNADDWQTYRDRLAELLVSKSSTRNRKIWAKTTQDMHKNLTKCRQTGADTLGGRPEIGACLGNLTSYLEAAIDQTKPRHDLGFRVPDKQYFDETSHFTEIPDFLRTNEFLKLVKELRLLPMAKAYLTELNTKRTAAEKLIFFSYTSQHLGTPDNFSAFERLLVVVPGNPERWVQFGVAGPGQKVKNTSVVAIHKDERHQFNVYFKDHYRTENPDGSFTIRSRFDETGASDPCINCHKSGVLPIFPKPGSVTEDELSSVLAVNEKMRGYLPPHFGGYADASKFGPGLGSGALEKLSDEFYQGCAGKSETKEVIAKIKENMVCGDCHHAADVGALNYPYDNTTIRSYILGGQMPPHTSLTSTERSALYRCLNASYFVSTSKDVGTFKAWLVEVGCRAH